MHRAYRAGGHLRRVGTEESQAMTRNCVECIHWMFDAGWGGTDVTAGEAWSSRCLKGVWSMEGQRVTQEQFAANLNKANTCGMLEPRSVPSREASDRFGVSMTDSATVEKS
jgi:hypothetical protein